MLMNFFLYYILPFAFVLGILITFHELGHFLIAKYFGVKVLKFSLGFGPKLAARRLGETEYLISLVPLGGYVKMLGESEDEEESLTPEEEKRSFSHQPALKRIGIVAAGPLFNFFLALLIFCVFYGIAGKQIMLPEIGQVRENSPAYRSGLQKDDLIISIDEQPVHSWPEIRDLVRGKAGQRLVVTVNRQGRRRDFPVTPEASVVNNLFGEEVPAALIGIVASGRFEHMSLGPLSAVGEGFRKTWEIVKLTCLTIVKLFQRVVPLETVGGPIFIGQMTGQLAQESFAYLIPFMAIISVNLGVLNLLPVPILDGGVILFLFLELMIGKPLSIKKRALAQKMGLFLLIMLMAVIIYNDVARLLK